MKGEGQTKSVGWVCVREILHEGGWGGADKECVWWVCVREIMLVGGGGGGADKEHVCGRYV